MSLRELARELYRLEREVEELGRRLEVAASSEERDRLDLELRRALAERNKCRAILASKKEPPPYRRTYT
ncbi:MAG: hypothetical protein AB1896_21280 [Thermodesulfobacteriota bacterium]